jgi:hypothetical protein
MVRRCALSRRGVSFFRYGLLSRGTIQCLVSACFGTTTHPAGLAPPSRGCRGMVALLSDGESHARRRRSRPIDDPRMSGTGRPLGRFRRSPGSRARPGRRGCPTRTRYVNSASIATTGLHGVRVGDDRRSTRHADCACPLRNRTACQSASARDWSRDDVWPARTSPRGLRTRRGAELRKKEKAEGLREDWSALERHDCRERVERSQMPGDRKESLRAMITQPHFLPRRRPASVVSPGGI